MKRIIFHIIFLGFICNSYAQSKPLSKETKDYLKKQLEIVFMKDQLFRKLYKQAEEQFGKESNEMDYFWEVVEKQDKLLEKEVISIIDTYGWLGISEVGRLANTTLWGVLQHGSISSKEKYAPLLKESVLQKESQPTHYARLIDRMLINSNKSQLYGTQYEYNSKGKISFLPIKSPESINKRRKEIGLNSIEDFSKSKNIPWTIPQKK
ncbi:hypothetical protein J8L88_00310 [Aquimarina sp. MMG015]|uniref:DUF6624 domain-containing protein n=1 Tax=Aquimarina TaxID=290174 RepID=UPI00047F2FE8|nr:MULTISPECIES: DUF6624 domain-containing protein [Aquimarina]AXT57478.1 hypothetical protein D1815_17640 [Aquimarina sp. AD1]MBQ4801271.1 hypothetical protein [Aquimarina sp. MMG015]RKN35740.1 hypothetical protein D7035_02940 [Aquimarina sp. AD1]